MSALGSVRRYDAAKADPRVAGRELKVDRVVRGSVSRLGGQLSSRPSWWTYAAGRACGDAPTPPGTSSLPDVFERFSTEVTDQLRLKLSGP